MGGGSVVVRDPIVNSRRRELTLQKTTKYTILKDTGTPSGAEAGAEIIFL